MVDMDIEIEELELQLKKRLKYHYQREKIQNDIWDQKTKFIYKTPKWDDVVATIKKTYEDDISINKKSLFNYASNRRYNFWSAH